MADNDWTKTADPVHVWTDADRPPLLDVTTPTSPNAPAATMTTPPLPPAGGGLERDLAVGGTRALGTPGDLISDIKPYVLDPTVNFLHNRLGIPTGPEIPIPTTGAVRDWTGVQGPQDRQERVADDIGQGVGVAATTALGGAALRAGVAGARTIAAAVPGLRTLSSLIPTLRNVGGTAISVGTGATSSDLAQEYFPDSLAMQLIASGVGGFGSAAIARRLMWGPLPAATAGTPQGIRDVLTHEYLGRAIGAGAGFLLGHEAMGAEAGGIAALIGGKWAAPYVRYAFSPVGIRSAVMGEAGGLPNTVMDRNNRLNWQNQVTDPLHRGGLQSQ